MSVTASKSRQLALNPNDTLDTGAGLQGQLTCAPRSTWLRIALWLACTIDRSYNRTGFTGQRVAYPNLQPVVNVHKPFPPGVPSGPRVPCLRTIVTEEAMFGKTTRYSGISPSRVNATVPAP